MTVIIVAIVATIATIATVTISIQLKALSRIHVTVLHVRDGITGLVRYENDGMGTKVETTNELAPRLTQGADAGCEVIVVNLVLLEKEEVEASIVASHLVQFGFLVHAVVRVLFVAVVCCRFVFVVVMVLLFVASYLVFCVFVGSENFGDFLRFRSWRCREREMEV